MAGATQEDRNTVAFIEGLNRAEVLKAAGVKADPDFMEAGKQVIADKIAAYKSGNKDFVLSDSPSWIKVGLAAMFGPRDAVDVATVEIGVLEDQQLVENGFEAEHNY